MHESDEEIEDPKVDEQMDTGIRMKPQQPAEEKTVEGNGHDEELEDDET